MNRFAWVLVGLAGCGPDTLIEVEVDSRLRPPDEVDSISLELRADEDGGLIRQDALALAEPDSLPAVILYEPGDSTPAVLRHRVIGRVRGTDVAVGEVTYTWFRSNLNEVRIVLEPESLPSAGR